MSVPGIRRPCLPGDASIDGGQESPIHLRVAQQRHRPGRGTVAEHVPAGRSFGRQPVMQGLSMGMHVALKTCEGARIADADLGVVREQRPHRLIGPGCPFAVPDRGQQDGPTVQIELPGGPRAEADGGQHGGQRGRRVVREVPMPERVPLPVPDDRAQRVVLQQQHAARRHPGRALGQGLMLVRGVHQAEAVDDHVSRAAVGRNEPALGDQPQPGSAVRAAVLRHHALLRQEPRQAYPLHGLRGLGDERGGLGALRFLGDRGIGQQLGQAAR